MEKITPVKTTLCNDAFIYLIWAIALILTCIFGYLDEAVMNTNINIAAWSDNSKNFMGWLIFFLIGPGIKCIISSYLVQRNYNIKQNRLNGIN